MTDHIFITIRYLAAGAAFDERVFAPLGLTRLVNRDAVAGFGKNTLNSALITAPAWRI
jgi:hypothetical protein